MTSLNGFNRIAKSYDGLSRLVFGNSLRNAQLKFLNDIPGDSNVLILGGGTGWLLAELLQRKNTCRIWYIEASSSMIRLAKIKIRNLSNTSVDFIHGTEENIPAEIKFHAIITFFYLDLFRDSTLPDVTNKLNEALSHNGKWLVADFIKNGIWWQTWILKAMYAFFKTSSGIESAKLPQWESALQRARMKEIKSELRFMSFIKTAVYEKED
jgi:ubiquinone/menaquinone biosynthesis C-methylase UbiE